MVLWFYVHNGSRWILLNIIMSHGCLLDQRLATQSGIVLDRRQNIRLIAEKKGQEMKRNVPGRVIKVSTSWALVWFSISSPFLLSQKPKNTRLPSLNTLFLLPPPILVCMVSWSLFSLNPPSTEIRRGLLEHSTSLLPLMSVCVPPQLQLI